MVVALDGSASTAPRRTAGEHDGRDTWGVLGNWTGKTDRHLTDEIGVGGRGDWDRSAFVRIALEIGEHRRTGGAGGAG